MFDPRDLIAAAAVDPATINEVSARVDPDRVERVVTEALDQADRITALRARLDEAIRQMHTEEVTCPPLAEPGPEPEERCGTPPSCSVGRPHSLSVDEQLMSQLIAYYQRPMSSPLTRELDDLFAVDTAWKVPLFAIATSIQTILQTWCDFALRNGRRAYDTSR
jgi:hypothetical protein